MCTALTLTTKDHYFGRTLDLDCSYGEEVCVMPRRFSQDFRQMGRMEQHFAMIGMATVVNDIPLFYDATNEYGLSMAGLNFPGNAYYPPVETTAAVSSDNRVSTSDGTAKTSLGKDNVAPFEFIPWILGQCKTVNEALKMLECIRLVNIPFSENLPLSPLHWMIADKEACIVVESMEDGLHIHQNPAGVMTNNPSFPTHLFHLNNYRNLRVDNGENYFAEEIALKEYCQGLGALGLPGDVSSMSRFVRIAFGRAHSVCSEDELSSVSQFFHLLGSVEMNRGICLTGSGHWDITVYTSCVNADRGLYYYTTYDNRQINCVDMHRTDLDGAGISRFPLILEQGIHYQN